MKKWNHADAALCIAFCVFLFALYLHLKMPEDFFVSGFLFVAEAALVGGVADWFAVTALFKKPLGFPYHTALLPRRRDAFIKASILMVQKQFFSRRKIFYHIEHTHFLPMLMAWLGKRETRAQLTNSIYRYTQAYIVREENAATAQKLADYLRGEFLRVRPEDFFVACGKWLKMSGRDHAFLVHAANYLAEKARSKFIYDKILSWLEKYEADQIKKDTSGWMSLMGYLAKATNIVNLEEAAHLMQDQLVYILKELADKRSPLHEEILGLFYEKAITLNYEPNFHRLVYEMRDSFIRELPIESAIHHAWHHMRTHFAEDAAEGVDSMEEHMPVLRNRLAEIIDREYEHGLMLLETDEALRKNVSHFLYDLIARSALHAQTLVGVIVNRVLSGLTDAQLNSLVYDKVEPDLIWIRMNGSIVGAGIGLLLFCVMSMAGLK